MIFSVQMKIAFFAYKLSYGERLRYVVSVKVSRIKYCDAVLLFFENTFAPAEDGSLIKFKLKTCKLDEDKFIYFKFGTCKILNLNSI
jgi:hypothetical protein